MDKCSSHSQNFDSSQNTINGGTASDIGLENAKSAAVKHAGLSTSEVTFKKAGTNMEDVQNVYETEFYVGGREYEDVILAADGTILEYEVD